MKKMRRIGCILFCIISFVSCGESEIGPHWIKEQLSDLANHQSIIVFQPNPMYEYPVTVNTELISIFCLDEWEEEKSIPSTNDESLMMLYCDFSDADGNNVCRLAVFSDGRILIQRYSDGSLANGISSWYKCQSRSNGEIFFDLADWIDKTMQ